MIFLFAIISTNVNGQVYGWGGSVDNLPGMMNTSDVLLITGVGLAVAGIVLLVAGKAIKSKSQETPKPVASNVALDFRDRKNPKFKNQIKQPPVQLLVGGPQVVNRDIRTNVKLGVRIAF